MSRVHGTEMFGSRVERTASADLAIWGSDGECLSARVYVGGLLPEAAGWDLLFALRPATSRFKREKVFCWNVRGRSISLQAESISLRSAKKKQLTKFGSAGRSRLQLGFTIPAAQWFEKLRIGVFSVRYHVRVVNHATAMTQRCYLLWHNVRTDFEVGDKPTRTGSWAGLSVYRVVLGISAGLVGS